MAAPNVVLSLARDLGEGQSATHPPRSLATLGMTILSVFTFSGRMKVGV